MHLNVWDGVFLAGFVAYVAIRGAYQKRADAQPTRHSQRDGLELALLVLVGLGNLLLPLLYLFTPWLDAANYTQPAWLPWCGLPVLVGALWLFWRAHADLDRNWSVTLELRQEHVLVTHGVYARVRHPMYSAILLFGLAQGLLLRNWLAGWSALATFAVMYVLRTPREERMLAAHFGSPYDDYVRRTGRLWPRLRSPR
jgi:protein-S-isoprenylcysteine O-methyltransferase Ste14